MRSEYYTLDDFYTLLAGEQAGRSVTTKDWYVTMLDVVYEYAKSNFRMFNDLLSFVPEWMSALCDDEEFVRQALACGQLKSECRQ